VLTGGTKLFLKNIISFGFFLIPKGSSLTAVVINKVNGHSSNSVTLGNYL